MSREQTEQSLFKTGEVIKRSGVSRQVLYQYMAMGLIEEASRTLHGHRLYGSDIFDRLRIIRELNASGYALKDIKEIFFSRAGELSPEPRVGPPLVDARPAREPGAKAPG